MGYANIIQDILEHIDSNLMEELSADNLAKKAAFSTYHFCRVFSWHVGYSVMEYIRLRRLAYAASELSTGKNIIDIAMDYGFETHSGFSKAFKRYYGVSPKEYKAYNHTAKPPLPNLINTNNLYNIGGIIMEPKFKALKDIKLVGYVLKTKNVEGENSKDIPAFWQDCLESGKLEKLHSESFTKNDKEYGACFSIDPITGEFLYVIGLEVKDGAEIPKEYYTCTIPKATYAIFAIPPVNKDEDFVKNIQGTWVFIMNEWFPSSEYEYAPNGADFELYYEADGKMTCDIYIPVIKK